MKMTDKDRQRYEKGEEFAANIQFKILFHEHESEAQISIFISLCF